MQLGGLQKMTLLDWPGKVACTLFLAGCDFRCPFCHNGELVTAPVPPALTEEELLAFLKKRQGLLDGVCVTGGEPLLHADLGDLLEKIRALGYPVKLDTNGAHPDRLSALWERGLVDYVAMDIKNSPANYPTTVGLPRFDVAPVSDSAAFLLSGAVDYEFRTTAVAELHDDAAFEEIARWIAGAKRYYIQCFVDRNSVLQAGLHAPTHQQLTHWADIVRPFIPSVEIRGE